MGRNLSYVSGPILLTVVDDAWSRRRLAAQNTAVGNGPRAAVVSSTWKVFAASSTTRPTLLRTADVPAPHAGQVVAAGARFDRACIAKHMTKLKYNYCLPLVAGDKTREKSSDQAVAVSDRF